MQADKSTAITAPTDTGSGVTKAAGCGGVAGVEILNISAGGVIRTERAGPANLSP